MGLTDNIRNEPIERLSVRPVVTVGIDTTVREACRQMREAGLGAAMVVDEHERAVGMFNEKLLIRLLDERPQAMGEPIAQCMTTNIHCLRPTETIATLIETMQRRHLRWVCVVDDGGRPTGLTGLRGLMEYIVEHFPRLVKVEPITARLAMGQREGA